MIVRMSDVGAGWYDDGTGRQRWWDGTQWTQHYAPTSTAVPVPSVLSLEERRARLAMAVSNAVSYGGRVESQTDSYAVIVRGSRPNHVLHLLLSVFTFGVWLIPWLIIALMSGEKRQMIRVDEYGNVLHA